jgi:pimeloyl-ACP methyl ester carboxylesterase
METATRQRSPARVRARPSLEKLIARLPVMVRRLTLNGVDTSVLEGGAGKPIVLLHGPGAYGAQWLRVIPALADTHRVIAPDLPGHGTSAFFDGAPTCERVTGWLDDLIECTCSTPPALVGHTLGGAVAARYAAGTGRALAALVLVDTLGLAAFQPAPAFGSALQSFLHSPDETTHDGLWSQCVFDLIVVQQRLGDAWNDIKTANLDGMRGNGIAAVGAWMQEFGIPAIPTSLLGQIVAPTTLIWGRHDRATPLSIAQAASGKYGWPLEVIDGAADDPTLEQPEEFIRILKRIVK